MNIKKMKPIKKSITKIGLLTVQLFGLMEIFILFGIQFFWIIYKGDLLPTENIWDLLAIIVPFMMAFIVGILCRIEKYRMIFRQIIWIFHLLICMCYLALFILLQTRDEFNPFIPFTWLFFFWSIIIGFTLISSIITNLNKPSLSPYVQEKKKLRILFGVGTVVWLITLGIIVLLRYPVYFWIFSCIFHAIMIPISIRWENIIGKDSQRHKPDISYHSFKEMIFRKVDQSQISKKESQSAISTRNFRILFLNLLFLLAWNQWGYYYQAMGSIEDNYYLVIGIFLSPLFYLGFIFAILNAKFKIPLVGECVGLIIIGLSIVEIYLFAPLVLGYVLLTIIISANDLSHTSYTSTIVGIQLVWILGLLIFTLNGMLRYTWEEIIFIDGVVLNAILFSVIGIIFCIYLGFFSIDKFIKRKRKIHIPKKIQEFSVKNEKQTIRDFSKRKTGIIIFVIIFGGLFSPFILLSFTSKGPPLTFPDKSRAELQDFCGTAHAGFTGTSWEYANLTQLGIYWTRVQLSWRTIEWSNDFFNFSGWDIYVENCTTHNIKIIATLNNPPAWLDENTNNYVPPESIHHYLDYVNRTVRHYKDKVAAWEIWNEPNTARFWDGPIEHYYYLFGQAVELIHSIDPDLYILGGSLATSAPLFPPNLDEMFKLGIMKHLDALSIHFYNFDPDTLYQVIKQYVSIGNKYGFTGDYVITEIGNPTEGTYPFMVSMDKLAENVIKNMVIASALQIKTVIWYCAIDWGSRHGCLVNNPNICDDYADPRDSERWFGLCYNNYTWKKAAYAFNLFSKYCANSEYRPDLIKKIGGISATDLMASLYQQGDGTSTLIMWYAPTLYESGTVKVKLDIPDIEGDILIHNIYKGTNNTLIEKFVDVGDIPVFITFKVNNTSESITLQVQESALAVAIYMSLFGTFMISICFTGIIYRREKIKQQKSHNI